MAQWLEPGRAMQLTTEAMVVTLVEIDAAHIAIRVRVPDDVPAVIADPIVSFDEGALVVDLHARRIEVPSR